MSKNQNIDVAVDAVIIGYDKESGLSIILIQRKNAPFKGDWALPGGFVNEDETPIHAAKRELQEETSIQIDFLEQLFTFGKPKRDPRKRVISIAHFGLVNLNQHQALDAKTDAEKAQWFNIKELPSLAFDHEKIIKAALERIKSKALHQPIGFDLLDNKFPFSDLEKLYSKLLDRPINNKKFREKILSLKIIEEVNTEEDVSKSQKKLYKLNKDNYEKLMQKETCFEI